MPHLILEFSPGMEIPAVDELCKGLTSVLASFHRPDGEHEFPLRGTFVRAHRAETVTNGAGEQEAMFLHAVLKIGAGRVDAVKIATGNAVIEQMGAWREQHFPFVSLQLSLEIHDLPEELSWRI